MNPIIVNPINKCEQAVANYLSSSLQGSASIFTGMDNVEKLNPPCIVVNCKGAREVYFNTRVYAFTVDVAVMEIAADDTKENFSSVAGNVAAYFADNITASNAFNTYSSQSKQGINIHQFQIGDYTQQHEGDAWMNLFTYTLIGALVPTT